MPVICRLVVPAQQGRRAFCLLRSSSTSASIQQLIFPSNFSDATTAATTSWPRTSPPPLPRRRRSRHSLHFSFSTWSNNNNNHDYLDDDDDASSSNQRLHHRQRIVITPGGTSSKHKKNDTKKKKSRIQQQQQDRPFLDRIQLQTRGGTGGAGCISYHRLGSYKKRPCGGHGGSGGNVYLVVDPTLSSLAMTKHHYFGQDGTRGGVNGRNGKNGKHVYVRVPQGVIVRRVMEYEEMMERMSLGGESIEDIVVGEEEDEEDASEFGDQSFVSEDESFNEHDLDGEYEHDGDDGDDHELEEEEEEGGDESDDDYQDSDSNDYDGDSESDYEDVNETINAQEEDEEEEEDDDDFDTQYEQMISTKRSRRRAGGSGGSSITPSDYNEVVNQGVRSEDGMFYWSSPDTTNADVDVNERQMMMASMAYDDDNSNGSYPSRKKVFLADLDQPNSTLLVAQGGKAGVGNQAYANRPYFSNMEANAAKKSIPGMGECTYLELELKLIADVGLVGFPNAGKSSLLSAMSRAKPKIASYPFTTLHPLVGSIQYRDGYQIVVADVPGLIEGAAEGRGRGIEFLRHIERTKVLVYMVDSAGVDGRDPVSDLKVLGKELREYGSSGIFGKNEIEGEGGEYEEEMRRRRREIMNRPSLILANKMDLIPEVDANIGRREEIIFLLGQAAEEVGIVCDPGDIMGISAGVTGEGLQALSKQLRRTVLDL